MTRTVDQFGKVNFEDELMTKDEAIKEVKKYFKGNKKFIESAVMLILSTHNFISISTMDNQVNTYNWEKFLNLSINTEQGYKSIYMRKGNSKYADNKAHAINDFTISIYHSKNGEIEKHNII